jgi:hypothetical protein
MVALVDDLHIDIRDRLSAGQSQLVLRGADLGFLGLDCTLSKDPRTQLN